MDNIITVGSFDVKDTKVNRKGGIREDGTSNVKVVSEVIKDVDIDMLGVQELTKKYEYNLGEELKDYYIEGNYRYGDGIFKIGCRKYGLCHQTLFCANHRTKSCETFFSGIYQQADCRGNRQRGYHGAQ